MNKVNQIVICKDDYESKEEFENAIKDAIMVLLNNNYIMTVKYDEKFFGIVSIEFNYADQEYCDAYPYWLMPEEAEIIECYREDDDEGYSLGEMS